MVDIIGTIFEGIMRVGNTLAGLVLLGIAGYGLFILISLIAIAGNMVLSVVFGQDREYPYWLSLVVGVLGISLLLGAFYVIGSL